MPAADDLRLIDSGPGFILLASSQLFIAVQDGETTVASVEAERRWARKGLGKVPSSVGCLVVLSRSATPPSAEVRAQIPGLLLEIAPVSAGLAMVIEGGGFRVAALRAVFTGFLLVRRLPFPAEVFATVHDALTWLGTRVEIDGGAAQRQIDEARRAHGLVTSA